MTALHKLIKNRPTFSYHSLEPPIRILGIKSLHSKYMKSNDGANSNFATITVCYSYESDTIKDNKTTKFEESKKF